MNTQIYEALGNTDISWYSCNCGLPNFNTSLLFVVVKQCFMANVLLHGNNSDAIWVEGCPSMLSKTTMCFRILLRITSVTTILRHLHFKITILTQILSRVNQTGSTRHCFVYISKQDGDIKCPLHIWQGYFGARGPGFRWQSFAFNSTSANMYKYELRLWQLRLFVVVKQCFMANVLKILKLSFIHHHIYMNLCTSKKKYIYWTSEIVVQTFTLQNYDLNTNFE
jgi:hypothetical protein